MENAIGIDFDKRGMPCTMYACALALEMLPKSAAYIREHADRAASVFVCLREQPVSAADCLLRIFFDENTTFHHILPNEECRAFALHPK